MSRPFLFVPIAVLKDLLSNPAVEDISIGSPAHSTEMIISITEDHPIRQMLAPRKLGGGKIVINHYANGWRFNWKDEQVNFQYLEFIETRFLIIKC